ncbi:esterase [Paractinoplanes abujensis]|nr:esterase [Actinoplanes abujensis]
MLLGGLWLTPSTWDAVVADLAGRGRRAVAVDLGGATLDDQVDAVLAVVDAAGGASVVVGHSAAVALAWLVADKRPARVAKVVMIGGFPKADGETYADFFPAENGMMAFPGWAPFEGADSADLTPAAREEFAAAAVPVPEGVSTATVHLSDERRYDVPVVLVCPEFSPAEAREWIDAGELPELARAKHVELVDIDSGHWPQLTRPADLARILADA